MKVEVALIVAAANVKSPCDSRFLFYEDHGLLSLPITFPAEEERPVETAATMLHDMTGLSARLPGGAGWVDLKQKPVINDVSRTGERVLLIPYVCIIPEAVKLTDEFAMWVSATEVLSADPARFTDGHREIIMQTLGGAAL